MAKDGNNPRSSSTGEVVTVRKNGLARPWTVKFGGVTIRGTKPSRAAVKANVARSSEALKRATEKLTQPGVVLRAKKDVPQFSVADGETGVFIRRLNGRVERGRLVDGAFQVID